MVVVVVKGGETLLLTPIQRHRLLFTLCTSISFIPGEGEGRSKAKVQVATAVIILGIDGCFSCIAGVVLHAPTSPDIMGMGGGGRVPPPPPPL